MSSEFNIQIFFPKTAPDELIIKYFVFSDVLRKERDPDEPSLPLELRFKLVREDDPRVMKYEWILTKNVSGENKIIANLEFSHVTPLEAAYESNKHLIFMTVRVLPDFRRQGIGTKLLKVAFDKIKEMDDITTIFSGATLDAGKSFAGHFGGKFSNEGAENRLRIAEIDWNLMNSWIDAGEKLIDREGVTLQFFKDCPEEILEEYCSIYSETMMQQPLGDFTGEIKVTPKSRREDEEKQRKRNLNWYTFISREKDGTISGLTEIFYHPDITHKAFQNLTGVKEEYRTRGRGKWLKAHMLKWLLEKYPGIKYITTGNDVTNDAMLSINNRLGFKPFETSTSYSFDKKDLLASLLD